MSKEASISGLYAEKLITQKDTTSHNLIDMPELKIEIKSCLESHKTIRKNRNDSTRNGQFKINIEQHNYLLFIDGYYLFAVLDITGVYIIYLKKIKAVIIEKEFKFTQRKITKHHYFSANWKKVFLLSGIEMFDVTKLI